MDKQINHRLRDRRAGDRHRCHGRRSKVNTRKRAERRAAMRDAHEHYRQAFCPESEADFECAFAALGNTKEDFAKLQEWTNQPAGWLRVVRWLRHLHVQVNAWNTTKALALQVYGAGRSDIGGRKEKPGEIQRGARVLRKLVAAIQAARQWHAEGHVYYEGLAVALPHLGAALRALQNGELEYDWETLPLRTRGDKARFRIDMEGDGDSKVYTQKQIVASLRDLLLELRPAATPRKAKVLAEALLKPVWVLAPARKQKLQAVRSRPRRVSAA